MCFRSSPISPSPSPFRISVNMLELAGLHHRGRLLQGWERGQQDDPCLVAEIPIGQGGQSLDRARLTDAPAKDAPSPQLHRSLVSLVAAWMAVRRTRDASADSDSCSLVACAGLDTQNTPTMALGPLSNRREPPAAELGFRGTDSVPYFTLALLSNGTPCIGSVVCRRPATASPILISAYAPGLLTYPYLSHIRCRGLLLSLIYSFRIVSPIRSFNHPQYGSLGDHRMEETRRRSSEHLSAGMWI
ncbi:hypothetical protein F4780DRAFT_662855 [Xylariomycetidae sp. FL0641]|nr:hypothetical protein F4780DRAFT_662855 [Xylariomycetidae sp. FL0641]